MARARRSHTVRKQARQRRAQITVEAMVTAAALVIDRVGVDGLTTTAVAEVAGVSIGTLYQYFPDREAIIGALVERELEHMLGVFRAALAALRTVPVDVAAARLAELFLGVPDGRETLLHDMPLATALSGRRELHQRLVDRYVDELVPYCEGLPGSDDARVAAWTIVHAVDGVIQAVLLSGRSIDRSAVARVATAMVVGYLQRAGTTAARR
jgi:AcrR family transcriptional regulator